MVERITNKYNTLENVDSINYTYGFFIKNHKGIKIVEHQGGVPGFNNYLTMLPNQKYVIITMFNNQNIAARSIVNNIIEILAPSELIEPKPQEVIEKEINLDIANKISGTYELSDGMELTFKLQNDTLWLTLPLDQKYQLFSQNDSTYFLKAFNAQCSFDIQKNGEINKMIWKQRAIDYHGSRVKERVDITLEDLKSIAGEYIQPHLNIIYSISYQDNKLILNTPSTFKKYLGIDTLDIIHVNGDKFMTSRLGIIYFTRDKQNKIDGFLMRELGRLENVKFEKLNK
jgi:hypothetical protein